MVFEVNSKRNPHQTAPQSIAWPGRCSLQIIVPSLALSSSYPYPYYVNHSQLEAERDAFLAYLANERRYSEQTIRAYRNDLAQVMEYLKAEQIDLAAAGPDIWLRYFARLLAQDRAPRTHARKVSSLRSFIRYLVRRKLVKRELTQFLKTPKLPRTLPRYLSEQQAGELVNRPKEGKYGDGRDRAILNLFYGGGLRLSEVAGLKPIDIEFDAATVRVTGKGNKPRIVPVGTIAAGAVKYYLEWRKAQGDVNLHGPIFRNRNGGPLSSRSIARIVKKYARTVTGAENTSPHALRHSFATHLLDHGADILAVKEMLGHESVSTTQIYTHVTTEKIDRVYQQAHPRSGKTK